jgi:hypothetical protein
MMMPPHPGFYSPYFMQPPLNNLPLLQQSSNLFSQILNSEKTMNNLNTSSEKPEEEMEISQFLTRSRRRELENLLIKTKNESDLIIKSKLKLKISRSARGSRYRGVSKNGKKWQVIYPTSYNN